MILTEYIGNLDASGNFTEEVTVDDLIGPDADGLDDFGYCSRENLPVETEDFDRVEEKTAGIPKVEILKLIQKAKESVIDTSISKFQREGFFYEIFEQFDNSVEGVEVYLGNEEMTKIISADKITDHSQKTLTNYRSLMGRIVKNKKDPIVAREEIGNFNKVIVSFDHRTVRMFQHHYYAEDDDELQYKGYTKKEYKEFMEENFFPRVYMDGLFGYDTIECEIEYILEEMNDNEGMWENLFYQYLKEYKQKNPIIVDEKSVQLKLVS